MNHSEDVKKGHEVADVPISHAQQSRLDTTEGKGSALATLAVIAGVLLLLVPFVPLFLHAVGDQYFFPQVIPDTMNTEGFRRVLFADDRLLNATFVSLRIATVVTVLSIVVGVPAARAMGLYKFRGRLAVEFFLLAPVLVPAIAVGLGLQLTFLRLGLANNEIGVVLVHLVPSMPYAVIILSGVFANYQPEIEDQARSLGATRWNVWWLVTFPAIRPGLAVAAFFAFLISWSQFVLTLLIGGGSVITLPILVFSLIAGGNMRITSVVSLLFIFPALVLLILVSRHLQPGKAMSGGVV